MKKSKTVKLFNIKSLRWAIELEVEFPKAKDSQDLIDRHRVLKGWEIDYDGSLDNGAEYRPKKSNKLYWNEESLTQVKEILALIKVHRGRVAPTTGLHIHVDAKKLTSKQIVFIIKEFVKRQRFIIKKFKIDPKRIDAYCKLLPKINLSKITIPVIDKARNGNSNPWGSEGYSYLNEKYYSLNCSHLGKDNYNTLEFRLFNGTLRFKELKERIYWTLNFIKNAVEQE